MWFEAMIVAILPCYLLFDVTAGYYDDWYNHTWMMGYTGAYLRDHFAFPNVINSNGYVGIAFPIFYGFGFFPLMGLISTVFHPHMTILLITYALYTLQYYALVVLLLRMHLPRWFADTTSLIITFAIYPLTNLYNRCALPEFFATVALTIGIVTLLISMIHEDPKQQKRWYAIALAAFAFMAVTHPVTLLNAGIFMALFCPLLLWIYHKQFWITCRRMACIPLLLLPLLAPWLYALYVIGPESLDVNRMQFWGFYLEDIDTFAARLSPVLFDRRTWYAPVSAVGTPFLDAPANLFLLGMAYLLVIAIIRQCGLYWRFLLFVVMMTALFAFYLWCSLSNYPWDHNLYFRMIQLPYRLVTMMNLSALCMLLGAGLWLKNRDITIYFAPVAKTFAVILCTAAACAMTQKMINVSVIKKPAGGEIFASEHYKQTLLDIPPPFWAILNYTTPAYFEEVQNPQNILFNMSGDRGGCIGLGSIALNTKYWGYGMRALPLCRNQQVNTYGVPDLYDIPVRPGKNFTKEIKFIAALSPFGDVFPIDMHNDVEGWYNTNVTAFPWNGIMVDGKQVNVRRVSWAVLCIYLMPGDHRLSYVFTPPIAWVYLSYLAFATAIMLALYLFQLTLYPTFIGVVAYLGGNYATKKPFQ